MLGLVQNRKSRDQVSAAIGRFVPVAFMVAVGSGCIRSPAEVDPPGEGAGVSGQAVVTDLDSRNVVGRSGVAVQALGTSGRSVSDDRGFFRLDRLPIGVYDILLNADGEGARAKLLSSVRLEVEGQSLSLGQVRLGCAGGHRRAGARSKRRYRRGGGRRARAGVGHGTSWLHQPAG